MTLFNKLPGFVRTPPGQERKILALLPLILVLGTLILGIPSLAARVLISSGSETEIAAKIMTVDIYVISLIVLHWTVVLTVAIGAFIVMVMKGPAYVADPYPLEDSEHPDNPRQRGANGRH
jgi:hypothetical protein